MTMDAIVGEGGQEAVYPIRGNAWLQALARGGVIPEVNERQRVKRRQRLWKLRLAGGRRR
jgi:hypothetical protein